MPANGFQRSPMSRTRIVSFAAKKVRSRWAAVVSKLDAVKLATAAGIPTVIANGRRAGIIPRIAAGERVGTLFLLRERSRRHARFDR
jgi:glutamate 5-kinase